MIMIYLVKVKIVPSENSPRNSPSHNDAVDDVDAEHFTQINSFFTIPNTIVTAAFSYQFAELMIDE